MGRLLQCGIVLGDLCANYVSHVNIGGVLWMRLVSLFSFLAGFFFCGGSEICAGRDRLGQTWAAPVEVSYTNNV